VRQLRGNCRGGSNIGEWLAATSVRRSTRWSLHGSIESDQGHRLAFNGASIGGVAFPPLLILLIAKIGVEAARSR